MYVDLDDFGDDVIDLPATQAFHRNAFANDRYTAGSDDTGQLLLSHHVSLKIQLCRIVKHLVQSGKQRKQRVYLSERASQGDA